MDADADANTNAKANAGDKLFRTSPRQAKDKGSRSNGTKIGKKMPNSANGYNSLLLTEFAKKLIRSFSSQPLAVCQV